MKYRCHIFIYLALLVGQQFGMAESKSDLQYLPEPEREVPTYLVEFITKLGLEFTDIKSRRSAHLDIRAAIERIGYSKVIDVAKKAVDDYTGGVYFRIEKIETALVIGRRYPLKNGFSILEVAFYRGDNGEFNMVAFRESFII